MQGEIRCVVDPLQPAKASIAYAARLLHEGRLVAFPTETVYGLGANALDPQAVQAIFSAKGRPAANPLIVHVATKESAQHLVEEWNSTADRLAEAFWPGPLTLVLRKRPIVPNEVTAQGNTVAVRVPNHPVALALLSEFDGPLAAPSANRSESISPTTADHVLKTLSTQIALVLDAGPCAVGLESTVVDLTVSPPRILRPGMLSAPTLRRYLPSLLDFSPFRQEDQGPGESVKSPGQHVRHYAPSVPLLLARLENCQSLIVQALGRGKVGWICLSGQPEIVLSPGEESRLVRRELPDRPEPFAQMLYRSMHELEAETVDVIVVSEPPDAPEWLAIHDRLRRAAQPGS